MPLLKTRPVMPSPARYRALSTAWRERPREVSIRRPPPSSSASMMAPLKAPKASARIPSTLGKAARMSVVARARLNSTRGASFPESSVGAMGPRALDYKIV